MTQIGYADTDKLRFTLHFYTGIITALLINARRLRVESIVGP